MKKLLLLIFILSALVCRIYGQATSPADVTFFQKYLLKNVRYPALARENNFSGQVIIAFWVDEDKSVTDIRILKGINDNNSCEDEIIRRIKSFQNGLNLTPNEYTCSFEFVMQNNEGEEIHSYKKERNLTINYKNFLFENKVIGYYSEVRSYVTDEPQIYYQIPQFTGHIGKVKLLTVKTHYINGQGLPYPDSLYTKTIEKFNAKGNLIEDIFLNGASIIKKQYSYNKAGDEVQQITYREDGAVFNKTITRFNQRGQIIYEGEYDTPDYTQITNHQVFEYDDKGLQTSFSVYNGKNLVDKTIIKYVNGEKRFEEEHTHYSAQKVFKYYTNGLLTEGYHYSNNGLDTKWVYKYDDYKRCISQLIYDAAGALKWTNTYKYDNKGNKISEVKYISEYAPTGTGSFFEYKDYDSKGNWKTAKWVDGNTNKTYIVKREIKY